MWLFTLAVIDPCYLDFVSMNLFSELFSMCISRCTKMRKYLHSKNAQELSGLFVSNSLDYYGVSYYEISPFGHIGEEKNAWSHDFVFT